MTTLVRLVDRLADLALYALAGFAAACLTADEPEPEWTPDALDRLLLELEKAETEADWVMWRDEMLS